MGKSSTSEYYAIKSLDEAKAFLNDPYLGSNLIAICKIQLKLESNNATEIFGNPDDRKLHSSMTLFSCVSEKESVFDDVLEKFFNGKPDSKTKKKLEKDF